MPEFTATIYEVLEDAIIAALAPIKSLDVEIIHFPDNEAENKKPFAKPRITVAYHSFQGGEQLATDTSTAEKDINIQVMFEAKNKRGILGIYDLAVRAEAILAGFIIPGYKRLTIGNFTQSERDPQGGIWCYNLIVKTQGVSVQQIDDNTPRYPIPGWP
jgi:hypothetical protein